MKCVFKHAGDLDEKRALFRCWECDTILPLPLEIGPKVSRQCTGIKVPPEPKPCIYRGDFTGKKIDCGCIADTRIFQCSHPDNAKHEAPLNNPKWAKKGSWACAKCPHKETKSLPRWITTEQRIKDTRTLMRMLPLDTAAIIGVARSGLAPATEIAMALQLPLYILDDKQGRIINPGNGWRLDGHVPGDGPWIAVDDCFAAGRSMARGMEVLEQDELTAHRQVKWATVYADISRDIRPDYFAVKLQANHQFTEWNFANSVYSKDTAWDIDGALLTEGENPGLPLLVPRKEAIPLICTGRMLFDIEHTKAQLTALGVRYERLVYYPGSLEEREKPGAIARHKAKHYGESECKYFVESEREQAVEIARLTGKIVICNTTAEVF